MDIKLYKVEPATDLPGNKYWIKSVPIFAEIERSVTTPDGQTIYRNYDEEWIKKTVQNHLGEQSNNSHLLPLKIGHSVPGKEVIRQSAGLMKIVGCDYTMYNGEPKLTIFADLLVPERVYHGMIDLEYPGASVEIWRPDDFRLSNCALLPDQDAEFKFPPIIPEELSRQFMECVPVNDDEFKLCIFSEFKEDTMNRNFKGPKKFASAFRYEADQKKKSGKNLESARKAANQNFKNMQGKDGGHAGYSETNSRVQRALDERLGAAQKDYNSKSDITNREAFRKGKKFSEEYDDEEIQEEAIEQNQESEEGEGASVDQQLMELIGDLSDEEKSSLLQELMNGKSDDSDNDSGPVMFSEQIQHELSTQHFEDTLPKEVVLQMFSEMAGEINALRRERQLDHTKKKISRTVKGLSQSQAIAARAYQFSEMYGDEVGLEFASAMAQLGPKDPMTLPDDYNQFPQEHEALIGQFSEIPGVEREIMKLDEAYENSHSKRNGMSKERYIENNLKSIKLSMKG